MKEEGSMTFVYVGPYGTPLFLIQKEVSWLCKARVRMRKEHTTSDVTSQSIYDSIKARREHSFIWN